ncbi:MAG: cupredoxin domain-containing protein [Nitrososphaerales archaeon]
MLESEVFAKLMSSKPQTVNVTFKVKYLWIIAVVIMLALAVSPVISAFYPSTGSSGSSSAPPAGATPNCNNPCVITIKNSQFGNGQPVIVKVGTSVTWKNADDTTHTSTALGGDSFQWNTGVIAIGTSSKPVTFNSAGTFPYQCLIHPMSGEIIVVS